MGSPMFKLKRAMRVFTSALPQVNWHAFRRSALIVAVYLAVFTSLDWLTRAFEIFPGGVTVGLAGKGVSTASSAVGVGRTGCEVNGINGAAVKVATADCAARIVWTDAISVERATGSTPNRNMPHDTGSKHSKTKTNRLLS